MLGRDGPDFTPGQQAWLTQMGERPLRPYTVTDVRPGVGATLCDALDAAAAPIEVHEVSASRQMTPGTLVGAAGRMGVLACWRLPFGDNHRLALNRADDDE